MDYSHYKALRVEITDKIMRVTLNRPDVLNAVNAQMHEELTQIWVDAQADSQVAIIVLTGEGKAFCAGGDINWMAGDDDGQLISAMTVDMPRKLVINLLACEKPIICSLNGDAVGIGATLALFCDIIIACDTARIGDPHVRAGLSAGDGGAVIWPQLIGYPRAKEYLMTGDLIPAPKAAEMGLINYSVPAAELAATTEKMVAKLARGALQAISYTKATINIGLRQLADSMLDAGSAYEFLTMQTDDHAEAVAAFQEGRRPEFKGS
ncbi:MAG: enoyl-CoA hydratase/isomerase family protein [Alphaproteobacteria bacterium]|nr:MAG: enoyl-CoA hydratase/isomerase family protein [Alphaproteobacteria bacterium]